MAEPPIFSASQAPRPRNTVLIVVLVILGSIVLCCLGVFGVGWFFFNKSKGVFGCVINFQFAQKAVQGYTNAHDGKLPPAKNWQTEIAPYWPVDAAQTTILGSSASPTGNLGCKDQSSGVETGMAYNSTIAGKKLSAVIAKDPNTILLFEVKKVGTNLAEPYKTPVGPSGITIMGKSMPWLSVDVEGNQLSDGQKVKTTTNTQIKF